jgi:hypothetical protein
MGENSKMGSTAERLMQRWTGPPASAGATNLMGFLEVPTGKTLYLAGISSHKCSETPAKHRLSHQGTSKNPGSSPGFLEVPIMMLSNICVHPWFRFFENCRLKPPP